MYDMNNGRERDCCVISVCRMIERKLLWEWMRVKDGSRLKYDMFLCRSC